MQSALTGSDLTRDPQPADNLILWLPVFLCCGINVYFLLASEPPVWLAWSGFGTAIILTLATIGWRDALAWRWIASFAVAASLGFALMQANTQAMNMPLLKRGIWSGTIDGTIQSFERAGTGWRVVLQDASVDELPDKYQLRLSIRGRGFMPQLGAGLKVQGSLMAPSSPLVPGSFDFRRYAFFQGIGGYGYASKILRYDPPAQKKTSNWLEDYRDWLTEKTYAVLKQPEAGIVSALLNGQRAGISRQTNKVLQQSGLYHVISISGLHVSIMAMTIFFAMRLLMACNMWLALHWPIKKIAAGFALVGIVFYLLIVGSSPPTLRSVIVTGAALAAIMLDREPIQMRVVALAALGILLIQPQSMIDIGFQMSFAAVIGLVAFYQQTRNFWTQPFWKQSIFTKMAHLVVGTVITSIVATIVTAPLVLLYFQQIPLLSMLANVLAAPPITFLIMPGTFLAYLLTPFPLLGGLAIHMMGWGVTLMMMVAQFVAHLPSAVWQTAPMPLISVPIIMLGFFILIAAKSRWRLLAIIPILIALAWTPFIKRPDLYLTQNRLVLYPDPHSPALFVQGKVQSFDKTMLLQWTTRKQIKPFDCTDDICEWMIKGKTIRLVRSIPALDQACARHADVIITPYYLDRRCRTGLVFDRHSLNRRGGQAVWLDNQIRVETVLAGKNRRPWQ